MKAITLLLSGVALFLCSCEQHYHSHTTRRYYRSSSSPGLHLSGAPSSHGIDAVGQPDSFSGN